MQPRSDTSLDKAWSSFFTEYDANLAVTLAYNPILTGTVFPAYRIAYHGECIKLTMPSFRSGPEVRRLATTIRIPCEQVHADVDRLHRSVDRKLFGSRFHKLSHVKRSRFIGLIENPEANVHVHLLWHVPEDRLEHAGKLIKPLWRRVTRYGSTKIKHQYDEGWASYCTKQRPALNAPELFVASRANRT
jgi:hypothetical protein